MLMLLRMDAFLVYSVCLLGRFSSRLPVEYLVSAWCFSLTENYGGGLERIIHVMIGLVRFASDAIGSRMAIIAFTRCGVISRGKKNPGKTAVDCSNRRFILLFLVVSLLVNPVAEVPAN